MTFTKKRRWHSPVDRCFFFFEKQNAAAIQSILDEANETPGAGVKKIKQKCRKWLNKRAGEVRKKTIDLRTQPTYY